MDRTTHTNNLLAAGRCGRCAERVSRAAILGADSCEHCGADLSFDGGEMVDALAERQGRWRLKGYALVALASFLAGWIPLLQVVVQLAALFVLHVMVLRRGLEWLSPGRRILGRMTMKLLGAAVAVVAVVVNVVIAPLVGAGAFVLAVAGPLLTAVYVEGSLWLLRRRLRWHAGGRPLRAGEWMLPIGLVLALVGVVGALVAVVAGAVHVVANVEVPAISEFVELLSGLVQ